MKKSIACLHVFIVLFALAVIPASAVENPTFPVILSGNVEIDGDPAPVGTEIVVQLNGDIVGNTTITLEGVYGDNPQSKLLVTCSPNDYTNLTFYVNGVESELIDTSILEGANPMGFIGDVNIAAPAESSASSAPAEENGGSGGSSSGGSGGGFGGYIESVEVPESDNVETDVSEESVSEEELMSPVTEVTEESPEESTSIPEKSSIGSIGMIAIGLIVVIGAIATVKYKYQK